MATWKLQRLNGRSWERHLSGTGKIWDFVNATARGPGFLLAELRVRYLRRERQQNPGCHRSWPVQGCHRRQAQAGSSLLPLLCLCLPHHRGCGKWLSSLAVLETHAFGEGSGGALPLGILPTACLQDLGSRPLRSYSVPSSRVSCQSPLLTEYLLAI